MSQAGGRDTGKKGFDWRRGLARRDQASTQLRERRKREAIAQKRDQTSHANFTPTLLPLIADHPDHHHALVNFLISKEILLTTNQTTFNLYRWIIEFLETFATHRIAFDIPNGPPISVEPITHPHMNVTNPQGEDVYTFRKRVVSYFENINQKIIKEGILGFGIQITDPHGRQGTFRLDPHPMTPTFSTELSANDLSLAKKNDKTAPNPLNIQDGVKPIINPPDDLRWQFWSKGKLHRLFLPQDHKDVLFLADFTTPQYMYVFGTPTTRHGLSNAAAQSDDPACILPWKNRPVFEGTNGPNASGKALRKDSCYKSLYLFHSGSSTLTTKLVLETSGSGHGLGRADTVEPDEYRFDLVRHLPEQDLLLDELEEKIKPEKKPHSTVTKENLVLCNTPTSSLGSRLPFEVNYYRRATNGKVDKSCRKNSPRSPQDNTLLNRPRSLREDESKEYFKQLTHKSGQETQRKAEGAYAQRRQTIKSKGAFLGVTGGARVNAGSVMKPVTGEASATKFLYETVLRSDQEMGVANFKELKRLPANEDVDPLYRAGALVRQEWCHLRGHGDGGTEWVGNFVCGSYHCNTEQLAIESAIRMFTRHYPELFKLHSTAYLIPNDVSSTDNWLETYSHDPRYEHAQRSNVGKSAPVAAFIRYKISGPAEVRAPQDLPPAVGAQKVATAPVAAAPRVGTTSGRSVIFDYTFEGQSEFFDVNQYRIVYYTVIGAVREFVKRLIKTQDIKSWLKQNRTEPAASTSYKSHVQELVADLNEAIYLLVRPQPPTPQARR